jgi:hypothetical protein
VKYQTYTIVRDPEPPRDAEYRIFSVPVHQVDGRWVPAGEPTEETHLWPAFDVAFEVDSDRIHGSHDNPGPLDDIPAPPGWTVVRRAWLPDDYVVPTPDEVEEEERKNLAWLKEQMRDGQ